MSDTHREQADSANRVTRLACAADPEAPLSVLLDLAMEYPETVATNPAFSVGLMSNPSALKDASPIALACLLTSPATTAELDALLVELVRSVHMNATESASARRTKWIWEYLDKWTSRGSRRTPVDTRAPAASCASLSVRVERMVRGQCILARRLGWDRFGCPMGFWRDGYDRSDVDEPLYATLFDGRVVRTQAMLSLLTGFWNGTPHDRIFSAYDVRGDRVRVQEKHEPIEADDLTVIFEGSAVPQYAKGEFEYGDDEIALIPDARDQFQALLAPWLKSSHLFADNRVLAVWCEAQPGGKARVATGTLDEVRMGLVATLEEYEDLDDFSDSFDFEASPVTGFTHLLEEVVPARGRDLEDCGASDLFAHLKRLPTGVKDLGGKRAISTMCKKLLAAALPAASAKQDGTSSRPEATLILLAGNGDVAVMFCVVEMSSAVIDASFDLDPVKI
jgi:hypothetical protein